MGQNTQPEARPRRLPAGLPLALAISLACHVLFTLLGYALLGTNIQSRNDPPLVDTLLTVPDGKFTLSFDDAPRKAAVPLGDASSESETGFTVRVDDLPPSAPASLPYAGQGVPRAANMAPEPSVGSDRIHAVAASHDRMNAVTTNNSSSEDCGLGKAGTAAFFGISARGQSVVYLIDRSISMGLNGGLVAAKRELLASVARLPATARVQVLFYSAGVQALNIAGRADLVAVSDDVRAELARLVEALRPEGGTNHLPALRQALVLRPDILFFITDADDLTTREVENLTLLNHDRTVIHTLAWNAGEKADAALRMLARYNRGTYRNLRSTVQSTLK
jgi:hypothetical protein